MAQPLTPIYLFRCLVALFVAITLVSADQYCGTVSNVTMVDPSSFSPQTADMNALKFGIRYAWPVFETKSGKIRLIRYCFANAGTKEELDCALQAGFKICSDAIGSPASPENKYSLGWMEVHDGNSDKGQRKIHFCYIEGYKSRQEPGTWNPEVKPDVMAIHFGAEGEAPHASIGWEKSDTDAGGRHYMVLPHKDVERHKVAHEIGHVLGMLHEYCRYNHDAHVTYRCEQVIGYQDAYNVALVAGRHNIAYCLCNSQGFANRYGFSAGAQYVKNDAWAYLNMPAFGVGRFDYGSIMIYPSTANAMNQKCFHLDRPDLCLLMGHWNNGPP